MSDVPESLAEGAPLGDSTGAVVKSFQSVKKSLRLPSCLFFHLLKNEITEGPRQINLYGDGFRDLFRERCHDLHDIYLSVRVAALLFSSSSRILLLCDRYATAVEQAEHQYFLAGRQRGAS